MWDVVVNTFTGKYVPWFMLVQTPDSKGFIFHIIIY